MPNLRNFIWNWKRLHIFQSFAVTKSIHNWKVRALWSIYWKTPILTNFDGLKVQFWSISDFEILENSAFPQFQRLRIYVLMHSRCAKFIKSLFWPTPVAILINFVRPKFHFFLKIRPSKTFGTTKKGTV